MLGRLIDDQLLTHGRSPFAYIAKRLQRGDLACANLECAISASGELAAEGTHVVGWAIGLARRFLDAGAPLVMIESEGITESVGTWRTDAVASIVGELGLDRVMFEAADPDVFSWYVKTYGPEVNLFVDHSQIVQLEALRSGLWGTKSTWGRILTYKGQG